MSEAIKSRASPLRFFTSPQSGRRAHPTAPRRTCRWVRPALAAVAIAVIRAGEVLLASVVYPGYVLLFLLSGLHRFLDLREGCCLIRAHRVSDNQHMDLVICCF